MSSIEDRRRTDRVKLEFHVTIFSAASILAMSWSRGIAALPRPHALYFASASAAPRRTLRRASAQLMT